MHIIFPRSEIYSLLLTCIFPFTLWHKKFLMVIHDFLGHTHDYILKRQSKNGITNSKGMDIFKAVDRCHRLCLQEEDPSFHPYHYSMSVSAAVAPYSRSCPSFTIVCKTVSGITAVTLGRRAQQMQAVCSFLPFFPL